MISCNPSPWFLSTIFVWFAIFVTFCHGNDPTDGFSAVPLNENNFELQRPYNVLPNERYSLKNGVRQLWVYSSDKPASINSPTKPRTEILMRGYSYSDGVWQFEGYGYVPSGTTGVSIMQILSASGPVFMLCVYDGKLIYGHSKDIVIENDIYNRWFRLNVIHTVGGNVSAIINGTNHSVAPFRRGTTNHYFKFGVYTQPKSSDYMESRWKGVKIYKKS